MSKILLIYCTIVPSKSQDKIMLYTHYNMVIFKVDILLDI